MVEEMQMGAATLSGDGDVLYCNRSGALLTAREAVLGAPVSSLLDEQAAVCLRGMLQAAENGVARGEISFRKGGVSVPTHVSVTKLSLEGTPVFCMVVADLTERKGWRRNGALEREHVAGWRRRRPTG